MKAITIGAKIWAITVFSNAFFCGISALLMNSWEGVLGAFSLLVAGFIITFPLLLIIVPLIELSVKIPYSIHARIAWLVYYLMLLVIAFYIVVPLLIGGGFYNFFWWLLISTTIAGLLVAVFATRTSLKKLNIQHDEATLMQNDLKIKNI